MIDGAITGLKLAANSITTGIISNGTILAEDISANALVKSINNLSDDVTLTAGTNIVLVSSGNNIQINVA